MHMECLTVDDLMRFRWIQHTATASAGLRGRLPWALNHADFSTISKRDQNRKPWMYTNPRLGPVRKRIDRRAGLRAERTAIEPAFELTHQIIFGGTTADFARMEAL